MRSSLTTQPISIMTCTTTLVSLYYPHLPPPPTHTHTTYTFIANPLHTHTLHTHASLHTPTAKNIKRPLFPIYRKMLCVFDVTNRVGKSVYCTISSSLGSFFFSMWPQVEQRSGERAAPSYGVHSLPPPISFSLNPFLSFLPPISLLQDNVGC